MSVFSSFTGQPLPDRADVAIIGAGIMGCATAYYLAKRGVSVVLLDKSRIAGQQSTRAWGFVRIMSRDAAEVPLMMEAMNIWPGLEAELQTDLDWRREGCLFMADNEKELQGYEEWMPIARDYQLDTKLLSAGEVAKLLPGLRGSGKGGLYSPSEGQAEPRKVAPAFAQRAAELGALIFEGCGAVKVETINGKVDTVLTEAGPVRTNAVLVCAGASSWRVLRGLGLDLPQQYVRSTAMRTNRIAPLTGLCFYGQHIGFRQRKDGSITLADEVSTDVDLTLGHLRAMRWFLPPMVEMRDMFTFRVNDFAWRDLVHRLPWRPEAQQPLIHDRDPLIPANPKRVHRAIANLRHAFPAAGAVQAVESWACHIDCIPDGIPVIGPLPGIEGLLIATGYCGHGFAMGPITGQLMTELITTGATALDLRAFRFTRFAEGDVKKPRAIY
ncbi:NAD(P)/FAD-dependent oxidoreductase [Dongia soli]|uniref:FAD-binding oxidoreductase n=1 Tax=Dongia soli TaxID=600628 RepID=A0ABU5EIG9_9PROT|nr:FAD-binding oxidoreductase [Dongia soli]MDY0885126.1 FAD-binding oxidoreductase [Dongia soli]